MGIGSFFNPILAGGGTVSSMDVDFIASTQSTQAGEIVSFTNLSDPTPIFNFWEFGDGSFSTASNPDKIYSSIGAFSITLNACDNVSGSIESKNDYIIIESGPVIVVRSGGTLDLYYSNDGVNFQEGKDTGTIGTIVYSPEMNKFIAAELSGAFNYHISSNGFDWDTYALPSSGTRGVRGSMTFNGNIFLNAAGGLIMETADGINWTTYSRNDSANGYGIASNNDIYIAQSAGSSTQRLQRSTNLSTWTNTLSLDSTVGNVDWVEDFGLFISYSNGSSFYTSTDGISWTTRTVPSKGTSNARYPTGAYSPKLNMYIMCNSDNALRYSTNGTTFTLATLPGGYTGRPQSVIWVDKLNSFFAYGNTSTNAGSNIVLKSSDGVTWTQHTANINLNAVQCGVRQ
jgi:hypothetical protein